MFHIKKSPPQQKSFNGTKPLEWLSFNVKLYLGIGLLLFGIIIQGFLTYYSVNSLQKDIKAFQKNNQKMNLYIQELNELSPTILSKCQSGLLGGTILEVSDLLGQLNSVINHLEATSDGADKQPLVKSYKLLNYRLQEYNNLSITKPKYDEIKLLYNKFNSELLKLKKSQMDYYQNNLGRPFVYQLVLWGIWFIILLFLLFISWRLFVVAGYSISKPATILTEIFQTEPEQIFKVEIPISSKEGLGQAGLLFKESFSYWDKIFNESKHSIQTFEALCKEFVTEIRKTELYTIQVQKVAELIVETTKEQERVIREANDELEYLNNNKAISQKIPNQMKSIIDELKHQVNLTESQTQTILQQPIEYQDESNEIADLAANLESASTKINNAIKVLDEVAERSELLAFNTAIQAARAGEKGMGFGVVAKEIAKLVERSKKASTRLSELLYNTQEKNKKILEVIHHKVADTMTVYEEVGKLSSEIFESARNNFEVIAILTKVMEDIVFMINDLSKEANIIANIPHDNLIQNSFEVEILDYQLNVKEANRIAVRISEISEGLRKLTETGNSQEFVHF